MGRDLRIFLRRLTGFGLWWLAFIQGLSVHATPVFLIVSATALLCWFATFIRHATLYAIAAVCYIAGLIVMLCLTTTSWLFNGALWGILLTLGVFSMAFLRALDKLQGTDSVHHSSDSIPECSPPLPIRQFVILYLTWCFGLVLTALISSPWQTTIIIAWSCVMLILGSRHVWPFAAYPEWLGYTMRRRIFISKTRWILRFVISAILLIISLSVFFLFL